MTKYRLRPFWRKLHEILFSPKSKEVVLFLFFVFVAGVFWCLQALDETAEFEFDVPLELQEVPDGVVITSPLPESVTVSVRDKGTNLMGLWRNKLRPIGVKFSDYESTANSYGRARVPQADVLKVLQSLLPGTAKIQYVRPDTLEFYYNHGHHKSVPVRVRGNIGTSPEFYLLEVAANPSQVVVYASPALLDTLSCIYTDVLKLEDLKSTTTTEVGLSPLHGAKVVPSKVDVTAKVDAYTERNIEVPVQAVNFPGDKQLRTFPSTVSITYTVGLARDASVTPDMFHILVTYEELLEHQEAGKTKLHLHLRSTPESVHNIRISPSDVDYLIESTAAEEAEGE